MALLLLVSIAVSAGDCLPSLPQDIYGLYTLKDTTSLLDGGIVVAGNACVGGRGYKDIGTDTLVTVKDENGTQLGQTTLGQGSGDIVKCEFIFVLKGIPTNAESYVFVVGHRGSVTRSHDALAADNWTVGISLGS